MIRRAISLRPLSDDLTTERSNVLKCSQYKISKTKLSISMIAVAPATETTKASLASWLLSIFMAGDQLTRAAVTPRGAGGMRELEATVPTGKRKLLCAVPDARRAEVNIKKLPLISHKAAANRTDALTVLDA